MSRDVHIVNQKGKLTLVIPVDGVKGINSPHVYVQAKTVNGHIKRGSYAFYDKKTLHYNEDTGEVNVRLQGRKMFLPNIKIKI